MNTAKVYQMKTPMQKQQDPLNLRSLPEISPPDDLWPAIETGLRRGRGRRVALFRAAGGLALAAAVVLAVGLVLRQPSGSSGLQSVHPDPSTVTAAAGSASANGGGETVAPAQLDSLIAMSQRLEGRLRHIRAEVSGLPAQAVVYQVELEDLVVQVDEQLSRGPDSLALWSQRVDLLVDLERLYESGLRREYHRMASL
jgi:hypothetical protein